MPFLRILFTVLLIAACTGKAGADRVEIPTALGRVVIEGSTDVRRLTSFAFEAAHQIAAEQKLLDADVKLPAEWRIKFLDRFHPGTFYLRSGEAAVFHTAVMNPPAEIYVDLSSFQSHTSSDALVTTLVHEIAHGLEFSLMDQGMNRRLRWHEEGFATWFEGEFKTRYLKPASRRNVDVDPLIIFQFTGKAADYDQASRIYDTIVRLIGTEGLRQVYRTMSDEKLSFEAALQKTSGLTPAAYIWLANEAGFFLNNFVS